MKTEYRDVIEIWLARVSAKTQLRFEWSAFLAELVTVVNGKPVELFHPEDLEILAWVATINREIQSRKEILGSAGIKDLKRGQQAKWLATGDPDTLLNLLPALDDLALSRMRTICRELTEMISTPIVNAVLLCAYRKAVEVLTPIELEMREGSEDEARRMCIAWEPTPVLRKLADIRLKLHSEIERIQAGTIDRSWWNAGINSSLGRFIEDPVAGDGWCPGTFDELKDLVDGCAAQAGGLAVATPGGDA